MTARRCYPPRMRELFTRLRRLSHSMQRSERHSNPRWSWLVVAVAACALALATACDEEASGPHFTPAKPWPALPDGGRDAGRDAEPEPSSARVDPPGFCRRAHDDVTALFCGAHPREISSLADVTAALHTDTTHILGHSTGLDGRLVSSINPRAVFVRSDDLSIENGFAALTFVRGRQRAEIVSLDRDKQRLDFYLLEFSQACNTAPNGCVPGDLFTPAIEQDWLELRVIDDEQLKNTPQDCRRCHGGAPKDGGKPMLLMRELEAPWMHWFSGQFEMWRQLFMVRTAQGDLVAAKGSEHYAGAAYSSDPSLLAEQILHAQDQLGQPLQPLNFSSTAIGFETKEFQMDPPFLGPGADDPDLSPSPTWQFLYDAYLNGTGPAPPYHHNLVADPTKLAKATDAYQALLAGRMKREELPDISDVLPDDQHRLAQMSFAVEPDAMDDALLVQACAGCHNASLDQSLSRAQFDVDLSRVKPDVLALAIDRLSLPEDDPSAMPPPGFRYLPAKQRRGLIAYLKGVDLTKVSPRPAPQTPVHYELELDYQYENHDAVAPLVVADLTGDGRLDLIAAPKIFEQNSNGTLAHPAALPVSPTTTVIADVDEDGRADMIISGSGSATDAGAGDGLLTFLSRGDLSFSSGIPSQGPTIFDLTTARFTDVNMDGHLDLVGLVSQDNNSYPVVVYFGDGKGSFAPNVITFDDAAPAHFGDLAVGDLTGDGIDDVVLVDRDAKPPSIAVYAHDGKKGFEKSGSRYPLPDGANYALHLVIGDANNDRRNDLVISPQWDEPGGAVKLLLQGDDGRFGAAAIVDEVAGGPVRFADMNMDGRQDLVVIALAAGQVHVLLQGVSGLQTGQSVRANFPRTPGSTGDSLAIGDLNSDGCPDVAGTNGVISVFYGHGCVQ